MMLRNIFIILVISCIGVLLLSCAHPSKQRALIFQDDETEKRVSNLQDTLRINPRDVESRMELGRVFLKEDFNDEAIGEFERVLSIDSNYIQAYLLLSIALQNCLNPDLPRVAGLLEKAIQMSPDHADAHLHLAQVYEQLKKEEEAISEFNKSIELSNDPATLVAAHLGLSAIYNRRGESANAQKEYKAAYKIYPGVKDMIKQAEINRITEHWVFPMPDEFHPAFEDRIKKGREEIRNKSDGEK